MLKNLKKGDQAKKQSKKQINKQKPTKKDAKKPKEQQEEQINTALVDVDYTEKQTTVKTVKKVLGSKLEEKQIDTSNIVIEKKQEKKVLTSWIVPESQIKNLLRADFNAAERETEFESLTDQAKNEELKEKAKKDLLENKPKIIEMGGIKMAPLINTEKGKEQEIVFSSKKVETSPVIGNIPVKEVVFVNTSQPANLNFAPLEKTAQQLKEQELEMRAKKEPDLAFKGKQTGWIGTKVVDTKVPPADFKVSAWAIKGQQISSQPTGNFAPLQKSSQEMKLENNSNRRQEQEFKYSSKKEAEERRKAKELLESQQAQQVKK